jgi:hypothetical protein
LLVVAAGLRARTFFLVADLFFALGVVAFCAGAAFDFFSSADSLDVGKRVLA